MSLTPCDHCGIPAPAGVAKAVGDTEGTFCCSGCATAYALIHSCGLEAFYGFADETRTVQSKPLRYAEFDRTDFLEAHPDLMAQGDPSAPEAALLAAALAPCFQSTGSGGAGVSPAASGGEVGDPYSPWKDHDGFRLAGS